MTVYNMSFTYKPKIPGVLADLIRQTIRQKRKRIFKVGDKLLFHDWLGTPYRSKWGWRKEVILKEVFIITISEDGITTPNGEFWRWNEAWPNQLAQDDGIDPPTGEGLRDVLRSKNGDWTGEYWVLRW